MDLYPLLMAPCFHHGTQTPWGGHMLRDAFLKDAPEDETGESLEVSALPGEESVVANGAHAGKTLPRMIELWGEALTGPIQGDFPLLLKLLDAQQQLSVQVHPDNEYAATHEGKSGKSEAWIILNAEPGAKIVYGLNADGKSLQEILDSGTLEAHLNWVQVRPGDVYYIPSGMIHTLGGGIQCYEIQQSSDLTYRLWDWQRPDQSGHLRPLHIDKAVAVAKPDLKPQKLEGTTIICKGGSRTYYISDDHFELCRLNLSGKMPLESGRMLFLTPMTECAVRWGDEEMLLDAFDTVLIPAGLEGVTVVGETKVLMSSLPDRESLRQQLGYRAENVAGLMD